MNLEVLLLRRRPHGSPRRRSFFLAAFSKRASQCSLELAPTSMALVCQKSFAQKGSFLFMLPRGMLGEEAGVDQGKASGGRGRDGAALLLHTAEFREIPSFLCTIPKLLPRV